MNMHLNEAKNSRSSLKPDELGKGSHPLSSSQKSPYTLDSLIQRAAAFYEYGPDDFVLIEEMKRTNPDWLRLALETDPLYPFFTHKEPT